jgi:hypothetical protein
MHVKEIIPVTTSDSPRGKLWAEIQRQNVLIRELRAVNRQHAQTISDKQAVIDDALKKVTALTAPITEEEWRAPFGFTVVNPKNSPLPRSAVNAILAARAKEK